MDYAKESLKKHAEWQGKIEMVTRCPVKTKDDLSLAYTPGVAEPCLAIQADYSKSFELTRRWNTVAVVTDGTAEKSIERKFTNQTPGPIERSLHPARRKRCLHRHKNPAFPAGTSPRLDQQNQIRTGKSDFAEYHG